MNLLMALAVAVCCAGLLAGCGSSQLERSERSACMQKELQMKCGQNACGRAAARLE